MSNQKMPKPIAKRLNKDIEQARLESASIQEFFEAYAKILKTINVEITYTEYPLDLCEQRSSHASPMGRRQAWSSEERADPNIPNTYPAYSGVLSGTITNNSDYENDTFTASHLFWCFGVLDKRWIHGKPADGKQIKNVQKFSCSMFLFIEDFPLIYTALRKETKLNELNRSLNDTLDAYEEKFKSDVSNEIAKDSVLEDLRKQKLELQALTNKITDAQNARNDFIRNEMNKIKLPFPKIENKYLNLNRYQKLVNKHEVTDLPDLKYAEFYQNIQNVSDKLDKYLDEHIEDFL